MEEEARIRREEMQAAIRRAEEEHKETMERIRRAEEEEKARREAAKERDARLRALHEELLKRTEALSAQKKQEKNARLSEVVRAVNAYRLKREAEERRAEEQRRLEAQRSAIHSAREAADRARERERANASAAEEALRKEREDAWLAGRKAPNALLCRVCRKRLEYADGDTEAKCPVCGYKNPIEGAGSGEYSIKFKPGAEKVVYSGGAKQQEKPKDDGAYSMTLCPTC